MTETPPIPKFDPNGPITPFQIKRIMQNCHYQVDTKDEWVQFATGDNARTSLKSITQAQAVKIMQAQTGNTLTPEGGTGDAAENYGYFDNNNSQHKYIRSLLHNANITVKSNKWGEVADMLGWLNTFLHSARCPVQKPLKSMTTREVSKVITALENVAVWKHTIKAK